MAVGFALEKAFDALQNHVEAAARPSMEDDARFLHGSIILPGCVLCVR